jgi:hypothetical protein
MSTIYVDWVGNLSQDISLITNYRLQDTETVPPRIPTVGDVVYCGSNRAVGFYPLGGVTNANWQFDGSSTADTVAYTTFNGNVDIINWSGNAFDSVIFNGPVTAYYVNLAGCIFGRSAKINSVGSVGFSDCYFDCKCWFGGDTVYFDLGDTNSFGPGAQFSIDNGET